MIIAIILAFILGDAVAECLYALADWIRYKTEAKKKALIRDT